jgi:TldD protein
MQVAAAPGPEDLQFLLSLAQAEGIEYFNFRWEESQQTTISLVKGVTKSCASELAGGFSVQCFTRGGWGFSSGQEVAQEPVELVFRRAAKLARWASQYAVEQYQIPEQDPAVVRIAAQGAAPIEDAPIEEKMDLVKGLDESTLRFDPRVVSTKTNYFDARINLVVFNSSNRYVQRAVAGTRASCFAYSRDQGVSQSGMESLGAQGGFEILRQAVAERLGEKAAREAIELLAAKPAPAGVFTICMDPQLTGTFVHEALGHAVEAVAVLAGESVLA